MERRKERERTGFKLARGRSGRWEIRFSERGEDGGWRSRTVSTRTSNRAEAMVVLGQVRAGLSVLSRGGLGEEGADKTVAELVKLYERDKPSQRWNLVSVVRELGSLTLVELTPDVVRAYRDKRLGDGIKSGTVRRELGALTACLSWAGKSQVVDRARVPFVAKPPEGAPRDVWLDEAQEKLLLNECLGLAFGGEDEDWDRGGGPLMRGIARFVWLGLGTGARKEALLDLTWDRVDWMNWLIDFRLPAGSLRGSSNKRLVVAPVNARLKAQFGNGEMFLFNQLDARRGRSVVGLTANQLRYQWEKLMKWMGRLSGGDPIWDEFTPHGMRHTFGTLLARAGVPVWEIAGLLGDSVETTSKHYLAHCPGHLSVAANVRFSGSAPVPAPRPPRATVGGAGSLRGVSDFFG